jgi:hypothetical protein
MIYLKATAVGIIGALIVGVAWMWAALQLPLYWEMWRHRDQGGVGSSYVDSDSILLAALIGFVLTFVWFVRRGKRIRSV